MLNRQPTPALILSKRAAAHLLGIDRGRTLGELLRSGQLRAVPWGKGLRIPLEEVQRLAREGFKAPGAKPRPSHRRIKSKVDPDGLRQVRVEDIS